VADFAGYGTVWFNPNGIANILSLNKVTEKGFRVTYDNLNGNKFIMNAPSGRQHTFERSDRGLYYLDTDAAQDSITLITTVADNKTKYTSRAYSQAMLARSIQRTIGRPSTRTFLHLVEHNLIPNCPITRDDILAAEDILGPDLGTLKGKTVRHTPPPVRLPYVNIPSGLLLQYRDVTLSGDIMFVNRIPFFITISRNIKFCTAEMLQSQQNKTILIAIRQVCNIYDDEASASKLS
jgi:hypothetical protein